ATLYSQTRHRSTLAPNQHHRCLPPPACDCPPATCSTSRSTMQNRVFDNRLKHHVRNQRIFSALLNLVVHFEARAEPHLLERHIRRNESQLLFQLNQIL